MTKARETSSLCPGRCLTFRAPPAALFNRRLQLALFVLQACSGQSPATVLDNLWNADGNLNSSSSRIPFGEDINHVILWFGQGFKTGNNAQGYSLTSVTLAFEKALGQPTSFSLEIYDTTPRGAPSLSLGQLAGNPDPDTRGNYTYSAQNIFLAPGAYYAMVVKAVGTQSFQNDEYLWFRSASTAITSADGWQATGMWGWLEQASMWGSSLPTHTWFSAYAGYPPAAFSVTATTVPEPASGVVLILGVAVGFCSRARNYQSTRTLHPNAGPSDSSDDLSANSRNRPGVSGGSR